MSYLPDANDPTQPTDDKPASQAAQELRAIKSRLKDAFTALASYFSKTGGVLTGNIAIIPPSGDANVYIARTVSTQKAALILGSTYADKNWQFVVDTNTDNLALYSSQYGIAWSSSATTGDIVSSSRSTAKSFYTTGTDDGGFVAKGTNPGYSFSSQSNTLLGYITAHQSAGQFILNNALPSGSPFRFSFNGSYEIFIDNTQIYATSSRNFGNNGYRWNTGFFNALNVYGDISAAHFIGDGSQLTGVPAAAVTSGGIISALGYTPYSNANPSGFISGISGAQVVAALGYTPYANNNPNGYISSVTAALGYTPYNATNPAGYINNVSATMANGALAAQLNGGQVGTNSLGTRYVSTSAPTGGNDGDIWFQIT